ncbi:MAG: hypothetical protein JNK04_08410, partial [Myxococcales bacterium]|nr:hypothetical protein [Myxococcales bacterium]
MSAAFSPPRPSSLRETGVIAALLLAASCGDSGITKEGGYGQGGSGPTTGGS